MKPGDRVRQRGCDPTGTIITFTPGRAWVYVRLDSGGVTRWQVAQVELVEEAAA